MLGVLRSVLALSPIHTPTSQKLLMHAVIGIPSTWRHKCRRALTKTHTHTHTHTRRQRERERERVHRLRNPASGCHGKQGKGPPGSPCEKPGKANKKKERKTKRKPTKTPKPHPNNNTLFDAPAFLLPCCFTSTPNLNFPSK